MGKRSKTAGWIVCGRGAKMKKMLVRAAFCTVLLWLVTGLLLTGATRTFSTKGQAISEMTIATAPLVYEVWKTLERNSICYVSPSGEGVAAAFGYSQAKIGFGTSYGLTNSGKSPWTNVTVTATIQVTAMSPNTKVHLETGAYTPPSDSVTRKLQEVSAVGEYSIKSQPFAILPNKEYRGFFGLFLTPTDQINVIWVHVQVKSIKFNL